MIEPNDEDDSTKLMSFFNKTHFKFEQRDKKQTAKQEDDILTDTKCEVTNKKVVFLKSLFLLKYADVNDTDDYADFDPDNALIFKNSIASDQAPNFVETHIDIGCKRKRNDIDELDYETSQVYNTDKCYPMNYYSEPDSQLLCEDDEDKYLESMYEKYWESKKAEMLIQNAAWRLGPAKLWFDLLGVPESGEGFDYGFRLANRIENRAVQFDNIEQDAFLMVSQKHWEDNIIWDIDNTGDEEKLNSNNIIEQISTSQQNEQECYEEKQQIFESESGTWYSKLPVENEELIYGLWEDEIIWDPKAMKKILTPKVLELDPNDENIILSIPDDFDSNLLCENIEHEQKTKNSFPHTKDMKTMLSRAGVIDNEEESILKLHHMDPFNISNDIYYMSKLKDDEKKQVSHSIPVLQLRAPLVVTYMGPTRLRNFHRPPLKRYAHGRLAHPGPHRVLPLANYINKKAKQRMQEQKNGEMFFMRSIEDLSGRDGNLVLVEFSEEHPPLMNLVGMCSKIKNYYRRKADKYTGAPEYKYGEAAYSHNGLFLGNLLPGQSLQTLENKMYRAPIYEHQVAETDFLVIRTRDYYFVREIDALYVAGQQCPLYEVPAPNSKKVADFIKNFLQVFAFKTFLKSNDKPPKIHKDVLRKAFPTVNENYVKKHISLFADYIKTGPDCFHWVLKSSFRLPLEDEYSLIIAPEQCCAYFSMLAAQQRLKDAGYGDKSAFALQENDIDDEKLQSQLDEEVKAAPWNTTRAYIEAMSGKCYLQLTGPVDPTGCGEGFSYVRVPYKSVFKKEELELKSKKIVGTNADLRYLSAKGAEAVLRSYGVPTQSIKELTRWELIDAVRTLSTIREVSGEEGIFKFSRGKRSPMAIFQDKYKKECQRIFDLQNSVLSFSEIPSSDDEDEDSSEINEDVEKMAENIENLLIGKKKSDRQLEFEREEREREELLKMLANDTLLEEKPIEEKTDENQNSNCNPNAPRVLKIHRTFRNADGSEYTRTEVVRNTAVIDAYLKIRSTKDATFIKQYAYADKDLQNEKKKIEAQLRALKYREIRKEKLLSESASKKVQCRACGRFGHTETDTICPKKIAVENQLDVSDQNLVEVDGTKLKFSIKPSKHIEETGQCVTPQDEPKTKPSKKRKRMSNNEQVVSGKRFQKPVVVNNQRTDPVVLLSTIFEEILSVMRLQNEFQPFLFPVNTKAMPNYRRIVGRPMDLQTIRENLRQKKYQSRKDFLADVNQIKENSILYNGLTHSLTDLAQRMLKQCVELVAKREDEIMRLEQAINPVLDYEDQETFSHAIGSVIQKIKSMPQSTPFLKPVNKNLIGSKEYYNIIKNPMDIETITKKVAAHKYRNRSEVLKDFQLIFNNCVLYNGQRSSMKTKAEILLKTAENYLEDLADQVLHLESSIASVQEQAMRRANIDTSWMYEDYNKDDCVEFDATGSLNLSEDESEESNMDTDCFEQSARSTLPTIESCPLNLSEDEFEESNMETDYIDRNVHSATIPMIEKSSLLEEDLQFSSDDELYKI